MVLLAGKEELPIWLNDTTESDRKRPSQWSVLASYMCDCLVLELKGKTIVSSYITGD